MAENFGVSAAVIIAAAKAKVAGWSEDGSDGFTIAPLTGGMSNLMFTVTRQKTGERVVARLLSPALDAVIDRQREMRIVRYLATSGIGPRLWGTYSVRHGEGNNVSLLSSPAAATPRTSAAAARGIMMRFEEFVDGRTLVVEDLRDDVGVRAHMAAKMAALHAQRPDLREAEERRRLRGLSMGSEASLADLPPPLQPLPDLRHSLVRYLSLMKGIGAHPRVLRGRARPELISLLAGPDGLDWGAEVAWMADVMEAHGGRTILCHGDGQPGNWIQSTADGKDELYLIDYEYSRYDYRAFDSGNQYCECTFDYSLPVHPGYTLSRSHYPPLGWQADFLSRYAAESARLAAAAGVDATEDAGASEGTGSEAGSPSVYAASPSASPLPVGPGIVAVQEDSEWHRTTCSATELARQFPTHPGVQALAREARLGILASHFYWSMWSAVMGAGKEGISLPSPGEAPPAAPAAGSSHADDEESATASGHAIFDYNVYGLERLSEYVRLKEQLRRDAPEWF